MAKSRYILDLGRDVVRIRIFCPDEECNGEVSFLPGRGARRGAVCPVCSNTMPIPSISTIRSVLYGSSSLSTTHVSIAFALVTMIVDLIGEIGSSDKRIVELECREPEG